MKAEIGFWWSSLAKKLETFLFVLLLFLLPTQLGKHFWFNFSYVFGQRIDYLSPTLYATDVLLIYLFFLTIVRRKIVISPLYSLFLLFFAISVFFAQTPLVGWYMLYKFLELSFFSWYVSHSSVSKYSIGISLVLGVIFESLLAIAQFYNQGSIGGLFYYLGERSFTAATPGIANASIQGQLILRPYATFSHPNMLAGYLVVGMLLGVALGFSKSWKNQITIFSSLLMGTIGLALSLSRTSIAAWLLCGVAAVIMLFHKRISKLILLTAVGIMTLWVLLVVLYPALFFRFLSFSVGESFTERVTLAKAAFVMTMSHPLIGIGPGNFILMLPSVSENKIVLQPVHNIYLLVSSELGIVGCVIFIAFLTFLFQKIIFLWKQSHVNQKIQLLFLCLALSSIVFSGFFDHYFLTLQQGQLLFALVIGLICAETR